MMETLDTSSKLGSAAPRWPGATDCHLHIFGPVERYPFTPNRNYTPPEAPLATYQALAAQLGIDRMVIVQPSVYGTDNSCTLDMVDAVGLDRARAIAVISNSITDSQLEDMHRRGVRGVRINALTRGGTPLEQFRRIADRVAPFGWHIQFWISGPQVVELADMLRSLPVPVVFDHMGQFPVDGGVSHPQFTMLMRLLESDRFWVKLCGYRLSKSGPPYGDLLPYARAIIAAAPDRCVWGSDWPHPHLEGRAYPDDQLLLGLLDAWATDADQIRRILVDNPARLYGF